jgi:hypothetical protein
MVEGFGKEVLRGLVADYVRGWTGLERERWIRGK